MSPKSERFVSSSMSSVLPFLLVEDSGVPTLDLLLQLHDVLLQGLYNVLQSTLQLESVKLAKK